MKLSAALVALMVFLMLFSCSRQSKLILGKWENKDRQETYEFRSDGKYEYSGSGRVRRLFGPYRIEKNRIYLAARMPSYGGQLRDETTMYEFSVEGEAMGVMFLCLMMVFLLSARSNTLTAAGQYHVNGPLNVFVWKVRNL